jgi:hypothetical protein
MRTLEKLMNTATILARLIPVVWLTCIAWEGAPAADPSRYNRESFPASSIRSDQRFAHGTDQHND